MSTSICPHSPSSSSPHDHETSEHRSATRTRAGTLFIWLAAGLVLALAVWKALSSFELAWDSLAYHLPFSGRIAGLCPESCYRMSDGLEARFQAFPKAVHYLQAALWNLTGSVQAVALLNLGAILVLCGVLVKLFRVSFPIAFLAFMAVPLVLIHSTSHYVDLPANVSGTIALLLFYTLLVEPGRFGYVRLIGLFAACAFLANAKPQMVVPAALIGAVASLALIVQAMKGRAPFAHTGGAGILSRTPVLAVCAVGLVLIMFNPLFNLLRFGNPIYPITLVIGPITLPGLEQFTQPVSISHALTGVPGPVRWMMSVLEINAYGYRSMPWTIDQGYVSQDLPSFRMGGYNVLFVLLNLASLAAVTLRNGMRDRRTAAALMLFAGTTLVTAFLPLSHELRYYMFWMLLLVSMNLALLHGGPASDRRWARLYAVSALVVLLSVNFATAGRYLLTFDRTTIDGLVKGFGIAAQVEQAVKDGDTVCLHSTAPFSYLYAPIFHGNRHYSVVEEGTAGCDVTLGLPPRS